MEEEKKENPEQEGHKVIIQTYKGDLSNALDATEADAVQQLLKASRDKENFEKESAISKKQRAWYTVGALSILLFSVVAILFAFYYYKKLTVSVEESYSVGIFQKSKPIIASETTIENIFTKVNSEEVFPENKPIILNIVSDDKTYSEVNKIQFFDFLNAKVTEPFLYQMQLVKLGEVNSGIDSTPFVIISVNDSEIASKEFAIIEPDLLKIFHKALGINLTSYKEEIGGAFESNYFYNLPVRILRTSNKVDILLFYGYVTPNTIVVTTKPSVFKTVYETIVKQI